MPQGESGCRVNKDVRMRARDLGIRFDGTAGPLNGITDVAGVEVGMVTLVEGGSADRSGSVDAVCSRSGVTAILPLDGDDRQAPCLADVEEFHRLRLETLCRVDEHDGAVDG